MRASTVPTGTIRLAGQIHAVRTKRRAQRERVGGDRRDEKQRKVSLMSPVPLR